MHIVHGRTENKQTVTFRILKVVGGKSGQNIADFPNPMCGASEAEATYGTSMKNRQNYHVA